MNVRRLQTLWLAWQRGMAPSHALEWQADCQTFIQILRPNLAQNHDDRVVENAEIAAAIASSKDEMWRRLCAAEGVEATTEGVTVYRGLNDEAAQDARLALLRDSGFAVRIDSPLSYSLTPDAALGFARKGAAAGLVYKVSIAPSDLAFFDIWALSDHNLATEREVVVWHSHALIVKFADVCSSNVQPGAVTLSSRTAGEQRAQRAKELDARWIQLRDENGLGNGTA